MPVDTHEDIMPAAGIEGPNVVETHEDIQPAMGMTAYHGSPHEFEQFDTSKIGTGEGAQAYGHGLYFAENENVAKDYRDRLTDRASSFRVENIDMPKWILRKIESHPDRAQAISEIRNDFQNRLAEAEEEAKGSHQPWMASGRISTAKDVLAGLDKIETGANIPHTRGRMYEVRLDVGPEHLLDWDKPLNEQHPDVQDKVYSISGMSRGSEHSAAVDRYNAAYDAYMSRPENVDAATLHKLEQAVSDTYDAVQDAKGVGGLSGMSIYNALARDETYDVGAKKLRSAGIRGIRYLDAGSRGKDGESGSHNYVIFDPQHIKVKRRYAEGGGVKAYFMHAPQDLLDRAQRAYGGAIAGPKLTEENAEDFARRLILWSYAAAPFVNRSIHRATGGEVDPSVDQALDAARGASQADPAASAMETARSLTPMGFYSAAAEAASKIPQRAPIDQIINKVKGAPGVKAEELDWSGVKDAFAGQRSVDPQEVARHFQANLPALQETVKEDPVALAEKMHMQRQSLLVQGKVDEANALKDKITQTYNPSWRRENAALYGQYTLPDGANYREVLLHLPNEEQEEGYKSSHWNVPNVVAHLRLSDRNMGKTLHMEELQSDWGQDARDHGIKTQDNSELEQLEQEIKNIKSKIALAPYESSEEQELTNRLYYLQGKFRELQNAPSVPSAPHITSNEGWTDLGLKRALMEAAKGGYNELIWTPGQEQADRYDLSNQVKHIMWSPDNNILNAITHDGYMAVNEKVDKDDIHKYIGKEAAKKLLEQEPEIDGNMATHHLRGQDISVGGEGMKNYYDRFLPGRLQKLVSKLDPEAKVQLHGHRMFVPDEREGDSEEGEYKNLHSLKITPKLRAAILKGLPAYKQGGFATNSAPIVNKALDVVSGLRR